MRTIAFFGLGEWAKEYLASEKPFSDDSVIFIDEKLDKDHIPEDKGIDIASIFVDSTVDAAVLEHFPNLKLIAARSTGYDHIDLSACKKRDVLVSTVPSYGENTVAEHAFALLLTLSKKIYESYHRVRETGNFSFKDLRGFDLKGKTLGVIGTGKIGRNSIRIAKGFGMEIIAHDTFPDEDFAKEAGFAYLPFEDVLKKSDIVTLHIPYMKETHHLINRDAIALMKKGAYLINTSRGAIVETEALADALGRGHISGAGLDVLEEEGAMKDELSLLAEGSAEEHNLKIVLANHVFIDMPNVIVTPHNAFNTKEALQRILNTTIENIKSFIDGNPQNVVK